MGNILNKRKICIIGGGWYGCHLGMVLKKMGIDFIILEKNKDIFSESSYKNQNRLHLGFHYARSYKTRKLCNNGYYKFIKQYGKYASMLDNNYYHIANDSIIDYETYKIIMGNMLFFEEVNCEEMKNIQGTIKTKEMFIENYNIKKFFKKELKDYIKTNFEVTYDFLEKNKTNFEFIFNCTNNALNTNKDFYFEKTLSLVYKKIENTNIVNGYTLVDGPLCSLYPYDIEKQLYTLTDVENTSLLKSYDLSNIKDHELKDLIDRRRRMEEKLCKYHKNFLQEYKYDGHYISLKIKKESKSDERDCYISREGNIINVFCDKILGIFIFEDYVKKLLD